ncbi:hypothetical protein F2P56_005394 [Juglans regia]|uniref:Uncharacterized protein n=1 Tax=Juglans regia TaxID=51240 RepID=A0A833Y9K1_JUGRE|nr:hypothetical protein F2P56_005394 [Juglans regia]
MLALLARLRALVQQATISPAPTDKRKLLLQALTLAICRKASSLLVTVLKQSVKISQEGIEVFREFYPNNDEVVTLECVWKLDKFVSLERTYKSNTGSPNGDLKEDASIGTSAVKYQSIESFIGDDELVHERVDSDQMGEKCPSHFKGDKIDSLASPPMESDNGKEVEDCR